MNSSNYSEAVKLSESALFIHISPGVARFINPYSLTVIGIGVLMNSLHCVVVLSTTSLQSYGNLIAAALSVANICFAASSAALIFSVYFTDIEQTLYSHAPFTFATVIQSYFLVFLAIECYLAVMKPLHYNLWITKRKILILSATGFLYSIVFTVLNTLYYEEKTKPEIYQAIHSGKTLYISDLITTTSMAFVIFWLLGHILLPCVATIALYTPIFIAIRRQMNMMKQNGSNSSVSHKGTWILFLVILFYLLTGFPTFILAMIWYTAPIHVFQEYHIMDYMVVFVRIAFANIIVTPLMYGFVHKKFRDVLLKKICCKPQIFPNNERCDENKRVTCHV